MASPRRTRARASQTPLPSIPTKHNAAYGASGRPNLTAQLRPGGGDFGAAFETHRAASAPAEPEDDDEDDEDEDEDDDDQRSAVPSVPELRQRRRGPGRPPSKAATPARRTATPAPPLARRAATPAPAALPAEPVPPRIRTALEHDPGYYGNGGNAHAVMHPPNNIRVFRRAFPRYLRELFQIANWELKDLVSMVFLLCCGVITFFTIWAFVPLPTAMDTVRNDFYTGLRRVFRINEYGPPPNELEEMWFRFKHDKIFSKALPNYNVPDMQWSININTYKRFEKVEARILTLETDMSLMQETMAAIKDMLPGHLVVRMVEGRYEIPEDFWQALQERLNRESDMAPLWQSYINRNERELERLNYEFASRALDRAVVDRHIVTGERFAQLMSDNNDLLAKQYHGQARMEHENNLDSVKEIAARTASDIVENSHYGKLEKMAIRELQNLARANVVLNTYDSLRYVNWFSTGLGALVDPYLTSPTVNAPPTSFWGSVKSSFQPAVYVPNAPAVALIRWEEVTDCWCASHEKFGRAQITILIGDKIYPHALVVEHIPATATLRIRDAPKDIEIWAETRSKQEAETIAKVIVEQEGELYAPQCGEAPSPKYVCIGKGSYDIHATNHVQIIKTVDKLEEMAMGTRKFTIKAASNWGGEHTCFYRLRMMGTQVDPESPPNID